MNIIIIFNPYYWDILILTSALLWWHCFQNTTHNCTLKFCFHFVPCFHLRVDSANNCHVLERVKLEIYHYVGGQDKCQWSDAQIEGKIYFENIYFLNYMLHFCWFQVIFDLTLVKMKFISLLTLITQENKKEFHFILCQIKNNLWSNLTPGKSYANMQHPLHYNLSEVSFKNNNNYYCQ